MNALRTIAMRIRGVDEDTGELLPKMKELIQTATNGKVDIMDGNDFKSTYQIMLEISEVWDELSDKQQAYLAENVAGKNRAEVFVALMNNAEDLTYAMEMAEDSIGSVDEEMAVVMQTFEKRVKVMKNAWSSLANTTLNSGLVKGVVDATTELIQMTEACGGLTTAVVALGLAIAQVKFGVFSGGITQVISNLVALTTKAGLATTAIGALKTVLAGGLVAGGVMLAGYAIKSIADYAENAKNKIINLKDEISALETSSTNVDALCSEFERLSKQEELSEEQTQRLVDVQNQLKEQLPEISGYYDAEGNFIIQNTEQVRENVEAQKKLLEVKREALALEQEKKINGTVDDVEQYKSSVESLQRYIELRQQLDEQKLNPLEMTRQEKLDLGFSEEDVAILDTMQVMYGGVAQAQEALEYQSKEYADSLGDLKQKFSDIITSSEAYQNANEETQKNVEASLAKMDFDSLGADGLRAEVTKMTSDVGAYVQELEKMSNSQKELVSETKTAQEVIEDMDTAFQSTLTSFEQTVNGTDILKVALNEMTKSGGLSEETAEKLAKKYSDIFQGCETASDGIRALNKQISENNFSEATDKIADLVSILEDLEAGNGITASSFKKISENFPELLGYMNDEATLTDAIKSKMEALKNVQDNAYKDMLKNSQEYYRQNVLGNEQMVNSISSGIEDLFRNLGTAYEGDLKNWKSLADGKADIEEQLINSINKAWEGHFNILMTQFNKMSGIDIATPQFDRDAYAKELVKKDLRLATNPNLLKAQLDIAEASFNSQISDYQAYRKAIADANKELANLFDFSFDTVDIKVGGAKASSSGSKSSSAKASYVASIFQEIVDDILKGGEDIEKAMDETQAKLDNATLIGDTALKEQLTAKLANLRVKLRDEQTNMVSELDVQIEKMAKILSDSGLFKNYDISKLTSKDLAEVTQSLERQINTATLANNDKEVDRLNMQKSLVSDIGAVYVSTIEKRDEVSNEYYVKEKERLEAYAENLEEVYQKSYDALDREDKLLELRKSMLLEDGGRYDKEEKEADQILDINKKLLSNLVKRRALCESQIAQLRAKGFSDESEQIQELIDQWLDYEQARLDMIKEIAEAKRQEAIDSAQNELDDISEAKDNIKDLLDLTIDMLKKETELKKEALKEQTDDKKEALKKQYEAEKKALEDKLDLVKKEADARKEALDREKDEKDYQESVAEKQEEIRTVKDKILELSGDDSVSATKKRKELEAELKELLKELEDIQYDRSIELQKQAIEDELKNQEEKIENELDSLEDQYDKETEMLEDKYDAELKEYEDYLDNQGKLKEEANRLIESRDKAFYERLKAYAIDYTDTTQVEFEDCWNKAYEALDKYGNKQLDVIDVIELMTQRVIRLNDELKKLNDSTYKDFIENDSSTSSDDYEFVGDKSNSSSNTSSTEESKLPTDKEAQENQIKYLHNKMIEAKSTNNKSLEKWVKAEREQLGLDPDTGGGTIDSSLWEIYKKKNGIKTRHTGLKTGEVGSPWGTFKIKSNEELNILKDGEIVLNKDDTGEIMKNVKTLVQGQSADSVKVIVDMHDFSVAQDSFDKFKKFVKTEVPKIINERLINRGIK